jgi:hypothetical protein
MMHAGSEKEDTLLHFSILFQQEIGSRVFSDSLISPFFVCGESGS